MTTILTGTVSAGPLFEWFENDRNNRAKLREAGYSDGRITNWKSRGIPRAEVGNIAPFMGMTYEEYVHAAEAWQLRIKKLRRVAAWAAVSLGLALQHYPSDADAVQRHQGVVYYVKSKFRRWIRLLHRVITTLFRYDRPASTYG